MCYVHKVVLLNKKVYQPNLTNLRFVSNAIV